MTVTDMIKPEKMSGKKLGKEFILLFYKKEGKALLGKGFINFYFLIGIFFLTFFAIGLANGSLEYLRTKMNDPFINWVNIDVPHSKSRGSEDIQKSMLNDKNNQKKFRYRSVTGFNFFALHFWKKDISGTKRFFGRTIEKSNPLLNEILSDKYILHGKVFSSPDDYGLIVTKNLLRSLNYPEDAAFIFMNFSDTIKERAVIPIPIVAVVSDLPGLTQFICTPFFHDQRNIPTEKSNPFLIENIRGVYFICLKDSTYTEKIKTKINQFISSDQEFKGLGMSVWTNRFTQSYKDYFLIKINIFNDTSFSFRNHVFERIINNTDLKRDNAVFRYYDFSSNWSNTNKSIKLYDKLSVELQNLDHINEFKVFMDKQYELPMEMGQIDTLSNYNFITKLTRIISIILMIFSILSICTFISNLLSNHLEKIRLNIGTFLAFGINPRALEKIYTTIIVSVLVVAMAIGILLSWIIGSVGTFRAVLQMLGIKLEENESYFNQFSEWTYPLIGVILIISYVVIRRITSRIFKQTPGNLLYDRI